MNENLKNFAILTIKVTGRWSTYYKIYQLTIYPLDKSIEPFIVFIDWENDLIFEALNYKLEFIQAKIAYNNYIMSPYRACKELEIYLSQFKRLNLISLNLNNKFNFINQLSSVNPEFTKYLGASGINIHGLIKILKNCNKFSENTTDIQNIFDYFTYFNISLSDNLSEDLLTEAKEIEQLFLKLLELI